MQVAVFKRQIPLIGGYEPGECTFICGLYLFAFEVFVPVYVLIEVKAEVFERFHSPKHSEEISFGGS